MNMSLVLFAGACIETWNKDRGHEERSCTYYEIFNKEKEPPEGQKYPYRYPKVSDELFDLLVKSKFPPPLLAVATSDVIPLNLFVKGERYSSNKNAFAAKVAELKDKCACQYCGAHLPTADVAGKQSALCPECGKKTRIQPGSAGFDVARKISDAHFQRDTPGKTVSASSLRGDGESELELENISAQDPAEFFNEFETDMDARLGWKEPDEVPQPKSPLRWNPRNVIPGTKVQNIPFHGGWKISRRMASYWRKNRAAEYHACSDFIRSLLKEPWPRIYSLDKGMASTAPLFNALLAEDLKRRKTTESKIAAPLNHAAGR